MPDMRYLEDRDKFISYAWSVFSKYFDSLPQFEEQFEWIQDDVSKNSFLKISAFYKFLVRDGTYLVQIDGNEQVVDYLDETYKFIAIISFIESLYEEDRYLDFFEWLSMKRHHAQIFPIDGLEKLTHLYRQYKNRFGSTKRLEAFFESLDASMQSFLAQSITVDGEHKPAEYLAKLLYGIRSEFVHGARLVLELSSGTMISSRGEQVIVSNFSLRDLMKLFEHGLLQHFNFIPYKK